MFLSYRGFLNLDRKIMVKKDFSLHSKHFSTQWAEKNLPEFNTRLLSILLFVTNWYSKLIYGEESEEEKSSGDKTHVEKDTGDWLLRNFLECKIEKKL